MANLKANGIPLDTLRNDNFSVSDMCAVYTGKKSEIPGVLNDEEAQALGAALKSEDVKRRRNEAEIFLQEHPGAATGKAAHK